MPRVGGGGGPVIPPGAAQQTQQTQQTQKSDFAAKVQGPAQATETAQAEQAKRAQKSALTGKVKELAKKFANGKLNQKEATREFVSLVIEERFPQFKKKKKKKKDDDEDEQQPEEQLEEAVTELIDRDPVLAKRLENQFRKLGTQKD